MKRKITVAPFTQQFTAVQDRIGDGFALRWLGQAGFDIWTGGLRIMIDPYLSDYLAEKYTGKEFAHRRMMESPIKAEEVGKLDYLLCTHRHSDHLDYGSVPVILKNNPTVRIIAPRAEAASVQQTGAAPEQQLLVNAGEDIQLSSAVRVSVVPACHEELKTDAAGNHHYLGYIIRINDITLYHSGDCIPFAGQREILQKYGVDIALLPINGRDEYRRSRGVPGNMSFTEAVQLCTEAGINTLFCQHFGMFEFNTADMQEVETRLCSPDWPAALQVIIPDCSNIYTII